MGTIECKRYSFYCFVTSWEFIHNMRRSVTEVWVPQEDGKSFVFNDMGGIFFCEEPRLTFEDPSQPIAAVEEEKKRRGLKILENVILTQEEVSAFRSFLEVRGPVWERSFEKRPVGSIW